MAVPGFEGAAAVPPTEDADEEGIKDRGGGLGSGLGGGVGGCSPCCCRSCGCRGAVIAIGGGEGNDSCDGAHPKTVEDVFGCPQGDGGTVREVERWGAASSTCGIGITGSGAESASTHEGLDIAAVLARRIVDVVALAVVVVGIESAEVVPEGLLSQEGAK